MLQNIDLSLLNEYAKKELFSFYQYLIFKYNKKQNKIKDKKRFAKFLSESIKTEDFVLLNREQRNER